MIHCGLDHKEYRHNQGGDEKKTLYNVIKAVLGKRFYNLRIRPIVFFLHSTVSRCFSKDSLVSTMISRCLWDVACITLSLLNTSWGCNIALDFRLKMTSCACFLDLGSNSFSTETLNYLSLPSHYSVQEQRYCYHGSPKTRTHRQQIV